MSPRFAVSLAAACLITSCISFDDSREAAHPRAPGEFNPMDGKDPKGKADPLAIKPNPKNLPPVVAMPGDDWTQFGHDCTRSFVSKESLDLPFTVGWTYTVESPSKFLAGAVAAAGYVHLHTIAEGNGGGMNSGFRNPLLVSLNALTGEYRGSFTPQKDVSQGNWLAVIEDYNVVYIDDALGAYDCRTFSDKRWVGLDRWGPLAADHQLKIVLHCNNLMADADPPLIEAHKYSGSSLWRNNVWPVKKQEGTIPVHEVNIAQGICLAAVRYAGPGPNPPKDGLYAFEAQKGAKLWFIEGKFRNLVSGAKRTYALEDGGAIHAYDLRTGKELWTAQLGNAVSSPGLWKDRLVALLSNGELVAMGAEEKEDGKILWSVKVDGAVTNPPEPGGVAGAAGNDRTAILLTDQGRALICTKTGLAVHDLTDGKKIGEWVADDTVKPLLKDGTFCPILARGTLFLCGRSSIVALWTSAFLRDQGATVLKQAELFSKTGRPTEALRLIRAVASTEGLKDAQKKKADELLGAVNKAGEKEFTDVEKLKTKGHLTLAKQLCDDIAAKYAGADVGRKAADEAAALAKQLEDPAVASEAGFKEAQSQESLGKKKEAALGYKAVAEKYPDTDFGKKAAEAYQKLKSYDK